jgi:hypothetical protein
LAVKAETAARRLATNEDERNLPLICKELDRLHTLCEAAQKVLQAAHHLPVELEDTEEQVSNALALVSRLDAVLAKKDADLVRETLAALVERVAVYFDHQLKGRHTFCTFARALVHFKEALFPCTTDSSTSCRCW